MTTSSNPWVAKFASPLLGTPNVHQAAHGGVAERAEHMMGAPFGHGTERVEHVAGRHQAGLVSVADVESQYAQVDAQMEATNAAVEACGGNMAATDLTTWRGQYAAWQAIKSDYAGYHSSLLQWASLGTVYAAYILKLSWFQERFTAFQSQVPGWQQKVQMACPNYTPPPAPPPAPKPGTPGAPPTQPSWVCTNLGINCPGGSDSGGAAWSTTILVVAVAVAVVAGFWFFAPVMSAFVAGRRITQAGADHITPESRRFA